MRLVFLAACLASGVCLFGCGRSSFEVAPVHGKVHVDGTPLVQGKVMFAPVARGELNPGRPSWGEIGPTGEYRLTTFRPNDGAVVGEHWVTIVNSGEELPEDVPEFSRFTVPTRVTVAPGIDNQIDLAVTSKMIEEFGEDDR